MLCPACDTENLPGTEECEACGSNLSGLINQPAISDRMQEHLLTVTAKDLPGYRALLVQVGDPVSKAIQLMHDNRYGCVLVVNGDQLVGIFTERDVLYKVAQEGFDLENTKIETVMTANPGVTRKDDSLARVLNLLSMHRYRQIPLVEETNVPLGFQSVKSVFNYLCTHVLTQD